MNLEPYFQQVSDYLKLVLPREATLSEARYPLAPMYGCEANIIQAVNGLVDFALQELEPGKNLDWRVSSGKNGGIDLRLSVSGRYFSQEDIAILLQPLKQTPLPSLGPWLAAAIARQHGGALTINPDSEGGLRLRLEIPDCKGTGTPGGKGETITFA
jgi:signal transduction histidine kinase